MFLVIKYVMFLGKRRTVHRFIEVKKPYDVEND